MKIFNITEEAGDTMVNSYMNGVSMQKIAKLLRKEHSCFQKTTKGEASTIKQVYSFVRNNYLPALKERGLDRNNRKNKRVAYKGNFVADNGIHAADYSEKAVKRSLEETTALTIEAKGGWFGIPGPAAKEHILTFDLITNSTSPVVLAERDMHQVMRMYSSLEGLSEEYKKNITFEHGDLFDVLKGFHDKRKSSSIDRFVYGHLDFCVGGKSLIEDGILDNLVWLSKWSKLQDTFYLDVSMCVRADATDSCRTLSEKMIPNIFSMFGWKVSSPNIVTVDDQGKGNRFMFNYNEHRQAHMMNALYKMERV